MTQLSPLALKRLEGSTCTIANHALAFERSGSHLPAARQGGEGYAVPVMHASKRFMLKSYFLPTAERKQRTTFLSALGLQEILPTLQGAPEQAIDGELASSATDRFAVVGYLAPLIVGETFEALLNGDHHHPLTPKSRLSLAAQLCGTIRVLESNYLAHGDLAMSNIMVADGEASRPQLKLIDFDGFWHPVVPTIPCSREPGGRGFGQDGYRHRAYSEMDSTVTVTSDRTAMAILAFELVALEHGDFDELERTTVLDQVDIDAGHPRTSDKIVARWPEGWRLVERALRARRPEFGPTPAEWYRALTALHQNARTAPPPPVASRQPNQMPLRVLERAKPERRVNLSLASNTFASVSPKLAWLSYERVAGGVVLRGEQISGPVFLTRHGQSSKLTNPLELELQSGDSLQWDEFVLEVG